MSMYPSNTAVPRYYDEFRQKVMDGEIPVCNNISLEMNRIDRRIEDPELFFDPRPVDGFIKFCEAELTLTDGSSLKLLDSFKLWAEQLLGWYYYSVRAVYDEDTNEFIQEDYLKRLINKQYLIVARGAAKSMYAYAIHAYFLVVDPETTHQIATAPTMKQAEEILGPFRTAIVRSPGPVFKFLTSTFKELRSIGVNHNSILTPTKRGVENFLTNSLLEIRPMQIGKLQGLRSKINTVDEWLSDDIREDVVGAIEQGASKLEDYLILAISSEGTVRNGPGDDIKLELAKILNGEYDDKHTSIFHYQLDDIKEVADPSTWLKANPNLGLTVTYDTYQRDVLRAEKAPAAKNDIVAKRFGIPMLGHTFYFLYDEILPHRKQDFRNLECAMGVDLSQSDDFTSISFLFPLASDAFGVQSISYIPARTFDILPPSARTNYEKFVKEKSLVIMEGSVLKVEDIFSHVSDFITDNGWHVATMGYDPYNASKFVDLYEKSYGSFAVEAIRQGSATESVPLGEIKTLAEDRLLIFDQQIMSYAMGNCMVLEDTNGNRKLYKRRYESKIDPVSATLDAYIAYKRHPDLF